VSPDSPCIDLSIRVSISLCKGTLFSKLSESNCGDFVSSTGGQFQIPVGLGGGAIQVERRLYWKDLDGFGKNKGGTSTKEYATSPSRGLV